MTGKKWWKSKTLWAAALTVLLGALETSGMADVVPDEHGPTLLIVIGALNALLRVVTTQPVRAR